MNQRRRERKSSRRVTSPGCLSKKKWENLKEHGQAEECEDQATFGQLPRTLTLTKNPVEKRFVQRVGRQHEVMKGPSIAGSSLDTGKPPLCPNPIEDQKRKIRRIRKQPVKTRQMRRIKRKGTHPRRSRNLNNAPGSCPKKKRKIKKGGTSSIGAVNKRINGHESVTEPTTDDREQRRKLLFGGSGEGVWAHSSRRSVAQRAKGIY